MFMVKNRKILQAVECIALILLLFLILAYLSKVLERKNCINEYSPFFRETTDFDILLFGSSHMACGVSPMDLWNDYGFTSYNFGNSGESMPVTYWTMEMAVRQHKPKMAVLDIGNCWIDKKFIDDAFNSTHNGWDCFPLTSIKVKAIYDLIEDQDIRYEYMFNLGKYHTRWNELTYGDFVPAPSRSKGIWAYGAGSDFDRLLAAAPQAQNEIIYEKTELNSHMVGMVYLKKFIESCQAQGIDVLLISNPYICDAGTQSLMNSIQDLADEYGINYLNLIQMDTVVDYNVDMMDDGHTNPSGMKKVTDYLGSYLTEYYDLEDHREDVDYASWWDDYDDFSDLKAETIKPRTELTTVLELLHDKSFSCTITVKPGSDILNARNVQNCMQNIVRQHILVDSDSQTASAELKPLEKLEKAAGEHSGYQLTVDNVAGTFTEELKQEEYSPDSPDMQISVSYNRTGEVIADMAWNCTAREVHIVEEQENKSFFRTV